MKQLAIGDAKAPRRGVRWRRIVRRTFYAKLGVAFCLLLLAFAFYLRLVAGPVSLTDYSGRVAAALAERIGPGWRVDLADTAIQLQGAKPAVRTSGLEIRNPAGQLVVRAPFAVVSVDPMSLLVGTLAPREIELRDLQLVARIAPDGSLSIVPPTEAGGDAPADTAPVAVQPGGADAPSPLSRAVASLLDPVLASSSLIGALDRATVTDARLTVIGADGRERAAFRRVNAIFERAGEGQRRMSIDLQGPRGAWQLSGEVSEREGERRAELQAAQIPVEDVMLLTGLSDVPAASDLKLSGHVSAALNGERLTRLSGEFASTPGSVTPPGQPPIRLDALSIGASWDENGRKLDLADIHIRSGPIEARLSGALAAAGDGGWRLALTARDTSWTGATAKDAPFKVADISVQVGFAETGVTLEVLTFKGDELDIKLTGAAASEPEGLGVRALIEARRTNVRRLLAFWPETVNPELRTYLSKNLEAGMLEHMELRSELDARDLKSAFSGRPISDGALKLSFGLSDGRLSVIDGLPPLRRLGVVGSATGTTTTLTARQGRIEMPDGRQLSFSDGSYRQADEDKPTSVAHISFRLDGGADALASFLRSPIFRELGPFEFEPDQVKGRADLKVTLPLTVHRIPPITELPVSVSGTLSDISVERIVGREKLDGAQLAVSYEAGALAIKGEGRLGGSPATFDLRQPKAGPGEVLVNLILDEAARVRRSLPSAPGVTGPVPVRLVTPIGPGAKRPTRVEVDLSKAAIDGILPGWTKPAGRPGRAAFNLVDGDGSELRDLTLESGAIQLKGMAKFGAEGQLDRAEFGTFKLSQGDDMRAVLERNGTGYRVNLRGNVGDARPVLKWMTGGGNAPAGGAGQKGRDPPDLDIDAALNIVTGNNDEALTGVTAKIGTRGRDVRALQLKGQFRSAALDAQLVRETGTPELLVRSGDAGATLRFLDLYRRMTGGELLVRTTIGDGAQSGTISIGGFVIRNEPALRRIAATTSEGSGDERTSSVAERLESDQVEFVKLDAEFRRTASRLDYKDVVVWGPQVGFTLGGYVDYGRDRTDILGTFIPAYGLNNAFSQVPIVGLLLGGGNRNEGLFAIDFRVSGQASSPTLTVNPLTAVAPGILRKFFGWMMPGEEATGATIAPPTGGERPARTPPRAAQRRTPPAAPAEPPALVEPPALMER